ncbi:hypothetical protein [Comamonas serinivorans]|uniref:hypothetical protein n=1 Tax=Comamonas serinivorans TaxID=1082851 RepID=UPI0012FB8DE1|nr:hypothetical protein [Comamonas serinivorans]
MANASRAPASATHSERLAALTKRLHRAGAANAEPWAFSAVSDSRSASSIPTFPFHE